MIDLAAPLSIGWPPGAVVRMALDGLRPWLSFNTQSHATRGPRPVRPIEDQIILITGATDGIGHGTGAQLARMGTTVLLHGRDAECLVEARAQSGAATGSDRLETCLADFA